MFCIRLGVALAVVLVGCSGGDTPELGTVEGTVTLDNKPLPDATVNFRPEGGGRAGRAITDEEGWYELLYSQGNAGTPPGKYTVSFDFDRDCNFGRKHRRRNRGP